jgi:DNA-binding response OmpR family regulator
MSNNACVQLKQNPTVSHVPVLLQAALASEKVYPRAPTCGAAGYLEQPYKPQALVAACEAALRGETYYPPL